MAARRSWILVLATIIPSMGASYTTQNFAVEAPTAEMAQQVGQYAEYYRKEKAMQWLGQEMPPWTQPCPLRVTVTMNGSGGATSFAFDRGHILSMDMHIEGSADRQLVAGGSAQRGCGSRRGKQCGGQGGDPGRRCSVANR